MYERYVALVCRTVQQQEGLNICSHTTTVLTTHQCILMDCFNNCNFNKHELMRPLMMCNCNTETCRSCFNVNFNVNC